MSTDSMPMYDSLADQLRYFLLNGGDYHVAPNLGSDVLDRIDTFAARFLALPDEHARYALVLWCAHCWLMDCWEHMPRLLFTSPEAGCGKTRALTFAGQLVPRPDHVADLDDTRPTGRPNERRFPCRSPALGSGRRRAGWW